MNPLRKKMSNSSLIFSRHIENILAVALNFYPARVSRVSLLSRLMRWPCCCGCHLPTHAALLLLLLLLLLFLLLLSSSSPALCGCLLLFLLASDGGCSGGFLSRLLGLQDLDDDLLLFDQKRPDNPFSDSRGAKISAIGSRHPLVPFGHVLQRRWARRFDALQLDASVAADGEFGRLLLVQVDQFSAGSLGNSPLVAQRGIGHPAAEAKALNHFYCC